jgi:hypothetical protein
LQEAQERLIAWRTCSTKPHLLVVGTVKRQAVEMSVESQIGTEALNERETSAFEPILSHFAAPGFNLLEQRGVPHVNCPPRKRAKVYMKVVQLVG